MLPLNLYWYVRQSTNLSIFMLILFKVYSELTTVLCTCLGYTGSAWWAAVVGAMAKVLYGSRHAGV